MRDEFVGQERELLKYIVEQFQLCYGEIQEIRKKRNLKNDLLEKAA